MRPRAGNQTAAARRYSATVRLDLIGASLERILNRALGVRRALRQTQNSQYGKHDRRWFQHSLFAPNFCIDRSVRTRPVLFYQILPTWQLLIDTVLELLDGSETRVSRAVEARWFVAPVGGTWRQEKPVTDERKNAHSRRS